MSAERLCKIEDGRLYTCIPEADKELYGDPCWLPTCVYCGNGPLREVNGDGRLLCCHCIEKAIGEETE